MKSYLYGAIVGDSCGAYYEFNSTKDYNAVKLIKDQNRFTDDTVCTIGVADAIIKYGIPTVEQFRDSIQEWCKKYPKRGYGGKFRNWILNPVPYGSWGNGSAMRVSACGLAAKNIEDCMELAMRSAVCSHNTHQAVTGAIIIASLVFYAKNSRPLVKDIAKLLLRVNYPEYAGKSLDIIRPTYKFDSSCQGTVPVAILCFLESTSYEDCIKLAISMGGDADTLAAISGSIAYPYYGEMQKPLLDSIVGILPYDMLQVIQEIDKIANE